jgi:hypothetical protein
MPGPKSVVYSRPARTVRGSRSVTPMRTGSRPCASRPGRAHLHVGEQARGVESGAGGFEQAPVELLARGPGQERAHLGLVGVHQPGEGRLEKAARGRGHGEGHIHQIGGVVGHHPAAGAAGKGGRAPRAGGAGLFRVQHLAGGEALARDQAQVRGPGQVRVGGEPGPGNVHLAQAEGRAWSDAEHHRQGRSPVRTSTSSSALRKPSARRPCPWPAGRHGPGVPGGGGRRVAGPAAGRSRPGRPGIGPGRSRVRPRWPGRRPGRRWRFPGRGGPAGGAKPEPAGVRPGWRRAAWGARMDR